jgi:hypothetical protein
MCHGVLDVTNFATLSPRFLTNILLVTVGSNFELWALRTQFTAHFSSFWLQTPQISSFEVGSTAKEAFFHITYRYVEINLLGSFLNYSIESLCIHHSFWNIFTG